MRRLQGIEGYTHAHDRNHWLPYVDDFEIYQTPDQLDPTVPLLVNSNLGAKFIVEWLSAERPIICMNRPHMGGWAGQHKLDSRRYSVNGYACTQWGKRTHDRFPLLGIERHAWRVRRIRRVLIAPPGKLLWFWHRTDAQEWAQQQAEFFRGQKVEIRFRWKYAERKGRGARYQSLWQDLDWADLVISWGSAITAEAFWYGKKVISLGPCPTWVCCDRDYSNWQDPTEPAQRGEWHEHMAWTQFTKDEMDQGLGAHLTIQYQGWPLPDQ